MSWLKFIIGVALAGTVASALPTQAGDARPAAEGRPRLELAVGLQLSLEGIHVDGRIRWGERPRFQLGRTPAEQIHADPERATRQIWTVLRALGRAGRLGAAHWLGAGADSSKARTDADRR